MSQGITMVEESTGYTFHIVKGESPTHQISMFSAEFLERYSDPVKKLDNMLQTQREYYQECRAAVRNAYNAELNGLVEALRPRIKAIFRYHRKKRFEKFRSMSQSLTRTISLGNGLLDRLKGERIVPDEEKIRTAAEEFVAKERRRRHELCGYLYSPARLSEWIKSFVEDMTNAFSYGMYDVRKSVVYAELFESTDIPEAISLKGFDIRNNPRLKVYRNFKGLDMYFLEPQYGICSEALTTLKALEFLSKNVVVHFPTAYIADLNSLLSNLDGINRVMVEMRKIVSDTIGTAPALPESVHATLLPTA